MPWKQPVALIALTLALAAGVAAPSSRNRGTPPKPPTAASTVTRLALACDGRQRAAHDASLDIEPPEVISVQAGPNGTPGQPSSLYIVRLSWSWLALADDEAGYGRVTLGVTSAPGTILGLYPHELHAPNPVSGALSVDAQQRLQVVPKAPGTIPIAASSARLAGHQQGRWAYWSAAARPREVLAPGHASAYVLLQVPPGQTHAELRLRSRAHVGSVRFGKLRSVCHAEAEERAFALSLPVPATPADPSPVNPVRAKRGEPR